MLEIIDKNNRLDWVLESKDKFCLKFGLLRIKGAPTPKPRERYKYKINKHQLGSRSISMEAEDTRFFYKKVSCDLSNRLS